MVHQSATKKRIIFGLTIFLEILFADYQKKVLSFSLERKERTKEKLEKALTLGILKRACGYTH